MIILKGTNIGIQANGRWLYQAVNFQLEQQHILALLGENGVGKTTLIQTMMGERTLDQGSLTWEQAGLQIAYVPQYRNDVNQFPLTITEYVKLNFDTGWQPWLTQGEQAWLKQVLAATALTELAHQRIDQASGGERQRAYLAQALVKKPDVLILDEATANLDAAAKFQFMDVLQQYQKKHTLSIIMVSHDAEIVDRYADDYLLIQHHQGRFGHYQHQTQHPLLAEVENV
ncbi:hypothetical protein IV73_GL000360 [Weissella kandleri]|uniref:ABC transporter domain-containing protein n=1 Tax=Weissella kandleri TaxID=1616 RepID=A0A0R2JB12_9LACO|nr:ATP-binding cassette domain-containing protein [Weissella kandleri]KRN74441.1 hypothetical protein IV73_GL000360 [Weissella kandleri]